MPTRREKHANFQLMRQNQLCSSRAGGGACVSLHVTGASTRYMRAAATRSRGRADMPLPWDAGIGSSRHYGHTTVQIVARKHVLPTSARAPGAPVLRAPAHLPKPALGWAHAPERLCRYRSHTVGDCGAAASVGVDSHMKRLPAWRTGQPFFLARRPILSRARGRSGE